ncbi:MAG: cell division protein ZipA C-terminal FtsZ-binding domain-containing protein [Rhodocyclales bacterium]|nr:cell division protein ZipA C-terminal FtsZ-binding domain-containing protein [Rhodocyclales bacterium]
MALSELHLALIGAGTAGVLMVWGYNVWQDRKHRQTAERIFNGGKPDALAGGEPAQGIGDERVEPTFESLPESQAPRNDEAAPDAVGDTVGPEASTELGAEVASASAIPADDTDPIVDCALRFSAATPIAAPILYSVQRSWSGDISKPISWFARCGDAGAWQTMNVDSTGSHREWCAALQLVDRRGAVSDGELTRFLEGVAALAQQTGATLEAVRDAEELAAHAQALDQFCAGVDIQFVLHVVDATGGSFPGTKLRGLAEAAGMVLEDDGLFHARDEAGGEAFSLGNLGPENFTAESLRSLNTPGVTFSIDVPRVGDGKAAFERMLGAARQLAGALGGVLVDAQRAPLAEAMIAAIRAKIVELQQRMRDGGIDPGSRRALRLFS